MSYKKVAKWVINIPEIILLVEENTNHMHYQEHYTTKD
jgi:hypothetical protein